MFLRSNQLDIGIITQADDARKNVSLIRRHGNQACIHASGNTNTHDQMTIGYSPLPYLCVLNGGENESEASRNDRLQFVENYLPSLISKYSRELSKTNNPGALMMRLAEEIESLREEHTPNAVFTMALSITYKKDDQLHCAGFGVGDVGLALRKKSGQIVQLACPRWFNNVADAFGRLGESLKDMIMPRNTTFHHVVEEGDEIFGFTHLAEELVVSKVKGSLKKNKLNYQSVRDQRLFRLVKGANSECEDDYMFGSVMIPDEDKQNEIVKLIYNQCKEAMFDKLQEQGEVDEDLLKKGRSVYNALVTLEEAGAPLTLLTQYFTKSMNVLNDPDEDAFKDDLIEEGKQLIKAYDISDRIYGALWKTLGVALMTLGGLTMAFGLLTLTSMLPAVVFPPGWAAIGAGVGISGAGLMLFDYGAKSYLKGKKIHDVNDTVKAMNNLANRN